MLCLFTAKPPSRYWGIEAAGKQSPKPFMLLGDFNGHHTVWGCRDINPRRKIIEDFLSDENLCLFFDDTTTYLHPASGSATAIDISLCDPDLNLDYTWRVNKDLCSSDHYPIFIESNNSAVEERVQHWRLHRADWEAFQQSCGESLTISQFEKKLKKIVWSIFFQILTSHS